MKRTIVSLSLLLLLGVGVTFLSLGVNWAFGQIDPFEFTTDTDGMKVKENQAAVTACAYHFDVDGLVRLITTLRVQGGGFANIDSAGIHATAQELFDASCAQSDCHDPVVQVQVCGILTGYSTANF